MIAGYMITDGVERYIRYEAGMNKYVPVVGQSRGTVWKDKRKADNIRNTLNKEIRSKYRVVQVASEDQAQVLSDKTETPHDDLVSLEELESIDISAIHGFEKWRSGAEEVLKFLQEADARISELSAELSRADKEVTDLLHFMEFNKFNASEGYKAYRMMHEILLRRRDIKNEDKVMSAIRRCAPSTSAFSSVLKAINGVDRQKYKPRVHSELFEQ